MTDRLIRIKQYEQAADDKVSIGGIKWLQKWDVCIQCDSAEEAEALRARLAQPEQRSGDCLLTGVCASEGHRIEKAQPEPEPVAWMFEDDEDNGHKTFRQTQPSPEAVAYLAKWNRPAWVPLYTTPPQREFIGLTDEEVENFVQAVWPREAVPADYVRAIEAKLKGKNA